MFSVLYRLPLCAFNKTDFFLGFFCGFVLFLFSFLNLNMEGVS